MNLGLKHDWVSNYNYCCNTQAHQNRTIYIYIHIYILCQNCFLMYISNKNKQCLVKVLDGMVEKPINTASWIHHSWMTLCVCVNYQQQTALQHSSIKNEIQYQCNNYHQLIDTLTGHRHNNLSVSVHQNHAQLVHNQQDPTRYYKYHTSIAFEI